MENYKNVKDYIGLYQINSNGTVKGLKRMIELKNGKNRVIEERILKPRIDSYGYITVRLSKNGKTKTCFIHRLIAEAFIPNPNNLPQINHISGDKQDNSINNLEWTTPSLNSRHAYRNGLNNNYGVDHAKSVCILDHKNELVFPTIRDFCEYYNIAYSTGRNALNKQIKLPKYCPVNLMDIEKIASTLPGSDYSTILNTAFRT